jgi:hypothetical protein
MIPFIAAAALKLSPVGAFIKRIPRGVWIALAVVAVIALGAFWHGRAVKHAHDAAYSAGVASEAARIEKKANALAAKATAIAEAVKERNNETNRRIAGDADDLRVRGPGKAACLNPATTAASRHQPSGRPGDAASGQVPVADGLANSLPELAAVPWPWLVDRAEQCDLNRAEVLSWRENYQLQLEAWKKSGGNR